MVTPSGPAQLGARARAEGQRQRAEQGRHRRHHDGPEAEQAGLVDGLGGRLAAAALRVEREVDHHDRVLLHDADEQDDADEGDDVEVEAEEQQREDRADARRGQRGQDRDRVDEALVEHAEDDVDGDEGGEDQQRLIGERGLERERRALEARRGRTAGSPISRSAPWMAATASLERHAEGEVERERDGGELPLVARWRAACCAARSA